MIQEQINIWQILLGSGIIVAIINAIVQIRGQRITAKTAAAVTEVDFVENVLARLEKVEQDNVQLRKMVDTIPALRVYIYTLVQQLRSAGIQPAQPPGDLLRFEEDD